MSAAAKIRADVKFGARRPCPFDDDARPWQHNGWTVTLRYAGRRMTVDFYTGQAAGEPDAAGVLECLCSDACTVENARSFEDWCCELGFDSDSRTAERLYKASVRQTEALRRFLGDAFDRLVYADEAEVRRAGA